MKKVFIAQRGSFGDPYVFSTREAAAEFIRRYPEYFDSNVNECITEALLNPTRL